MKTFPFLEDVRLETCVFSHSAYDNVEAVDPSLIPDLKRGSGNRKKKIFLRLRRLRRCLIVIVLTIFNLHWVLTLFTIAIAIAIFTLRSEAKRKRLSEKDFKVKTQRFATQFDFRVFLLPNFKRCRIQLMLEKFQDLKKHFGLGQEY